MSNPGIYRRPPFPNRPWVSGGLYDTLARPSILHCDAYLAVTSSYDALVIDWREGGRRQIALDAWLVEPDGLTPIWDASTLDIRTHGYWTRWNDALMARVHKRVLVLASEAEQSGRWSRVSFMAHYVYVPDGDPMDGVKNMYAGYGNKT